MTSDMQTMRDSSMLFGINMPYIENLYEAYLTDRDSVSDEWRTYFDALQKEPHALLQEIAHSPIVHAFAALPFSGLHGEPKDADLVRKQVAQRPDRPCYVLGFTLRSWSPPVRR